MPSGGHRHVVRLPSRPHNEVLWHPDADTVTKSSRNRDKILSEALWLSQAQDAGGVRVRTVHDEGSHASYVMDYIDQPTVASVLLSDGHQDTPYWDAWFTQLSQTLRALHTPTGATASAALAQSACSAMYLAKTQERVEAWATRHSPHLWTQSVAVNGRRLASLQETLADLPDLVQGSILNEAVPFTRIHGDLCLGNMFFAGTGTITLIDPRGDFGGAGISGDPTYDLAKLAHSLIGGYDAIVAGRYHMSADYSELVVDTPTQLAGRLREFLTDALPHYGVSPLRLDTAHALVMLSLADLHSEDPRRQVALTLRGMELLEDARS